jgi:hypothetical protein
VDCLGVAFEQEEFDDKALFQFCICPTNRFLTSNPKAHQKIKYNESLEHYFRK